MNDIADSVTPFEDYLSGMIVFVFHALGITGFVEFWIILISWISLVYGYLCIVNYRHYRRGYWFIGCAFFLIFLAHPLYYFVVDFLSEGAKWTGRLR